MGDSDSLKYLELSRKHLDRVHAAWDEPTDWADLTLYGFYALEAAIMAAAEHLGWTLAKTHYAKGVAADRLNVEHGLPDISDLLRKLNDGRKAVAYGDTDFPEIDPEEVDRVVEEYIDAVTALIERS